MSRLRARTWTPLERRVMGYWKNRNLLRLIILERRTGTRWGHDLALNAAERIMRTKGIDLRLARLRAGRDVEKHIDPVTGMGYRDIVEAYAHRDGTRDRAGNDRWVARCDRAKLSRYANRKYPLKRPVPVSRVIVSSPDVEAWFILGWCPSDSNPNIYVRREA